MSGLWDRKGKNRLSRLLWSVGIGAGLGLGAKFGVKKWDASKSAETEESWEERQREEGMTKELEDRIKRGQAYIENAKKLSPGSNVEEEIAQHQEKVEALRKEMNIIRRLLEDTRSSAPGDKWRIKLFEPITNRYVVKDYVPRNEAIALLEQHRTNLRQQYPEYLKDHPVLSAREAAEMIGPHELAKIYQGNRQ